MKRFLGVILGLIMSLIMGLTAFAAIPDASDAFYVNDFANVLSEDTIAYIVNTNDALFAKTGAQIVISTVEFMGATDSATYAYDMYNKYKIGSSEGNGVLFVMFTGDDDYFFSTGAAFEKLFSASVLSDIMDDYTEPYFKRKDYDGAALASFNAMLSVVEKYYGVNVTSGGNTAQSGVTSNPKPNQTTQPVQRQEESSGGGFFSFVFGMIILLIIISIISNMFRPRVYMGRRRPFFGGFFFPRYHHHHHNMPHNHGHRPPTPPGPRPPSGPNFGGGGFTRGGGAGRPSSFGGGSRPGGGFGGGRPGGGFGGGGFGGGGFGGGGRSGGGGFSRGGGAGRK